jgi:CMP-N-acetylneuraminic acid synthetase
VIAIVPARGGSKRIPRKNIAPFFGHAMLAYAIAGARNTGLFKHVVVSTEDEEIARVARECGADVSIRPPELATDAAGLVEVAEHVLAGYAARDDDAFCQLMPNCPLRRAADIRAHWEAFSSGDRRFQISVVPYRVVYPQWALAAAADRTGSWYYGENLGPSQALPELFCPTGAIWWARVSDFRTQRRFYGRPFHIEPLDANRGIDIDTPEDLEFADLLVRGLRDRDGVDPLEPCP